MQTRFKGAPDVCFVPSFGMPLADTTRAMSADFLSDETAHFPELCLVYPRPMAKEAGK